MAVKKEELKKIIDEYIGGLIRFNIPPDNIKKMRSLLNDFYRTVTERDGE